MRIHQAVAMAMGIMIVASVVPGTVQIADAALVAHWALDDGQADPNMLMAVDTVSPAADGTWAGGALGMIPRWVPGIAGGAAAFGGKGATTNSSLGPGTDDVITIPTTVGSDGDKLNITGALTIAAWIKYEEREGRNSTRHIAGKDRAGGATGDAYSLKHDMTTANASFQRVQFLIASGTVNNNLTSNQTLGAYTAASQHNGWVHVAGVFEPGQFMRLYIDGALDNELTSGVPAAIDFEPSTPFNIGRLDNSTTHSFNGAIDDVQVYSIALTDAQIARLFSNPGLAIPEPSSLLLLVFGGVVALAAERKR